MDIVQLADKYGFLIAAGLWLVVKGFGFITDRFYPGWAKSKEDRDRAVRDADATLLKARIDREQREFEWRRKLEDRQVAALGTLSQVSRLLCSLTLSM